MVSMTLNTYEFGLPEGEVSERDALVALAPFFAG